MLLVTAEEMREIDRRTIEEVGIPGVVLMENAGSQVARKIKEVIGDKRANIIVLSGHGNNGGDGFVTARHLGNNGYHVETWVIGDMKKCSEENLNHFHSLVHSGYKVKFWHDDGDELLREKLRNADVIVDALLGTGVVGALREPIRSLISFINHNTNALKIAVDMPTGVNSNTGEVVDTAFKAAYTVTFGYPKLGQLLYPGAEYIGELVVADISIPPSVVKTLSLKHYAITKETVQPLLPIRHPNSHKGNYGHTLIFGGSKNMPGAPTLAALASLRSGSGLTTLAVPKSIQPMVFSRIPEAICMGLKEAKGYFALDSLEGLDWEREYTAIGVGPGIGNWEQGFEWLGLLFKVASMPMVIDADGLNLLSKDLSILLKREYPTILTPHPGEMARLLQKDTAYVTKNRVSVSKDFAMKYGVYLVLKGAHTIIATPDGEIFINTTGGPELAKGGSGDVLTGMVTGLLAQKIPEKEALMLAVYLHGLAGNLASSPSNYSTLATDVIENIGLAFHQTMSKSR